jgi:phospholipid transport system substrate-binding protein
VVPKDKAPDKTEAQRIARRSFLTAAVALAGAAGPRFARAAADSPATVIHSFYDVLLRAMKGGPSLGFAGRRDMLAPACLQTFNFPLMTRLMVGLQWPQLSTDQQTQLVQSFSAFSVATYASRFDDYSGERFEVDDTPHASANGDTIVKSQLVERSGETVELDYLMHDGLASWQAIDIYLSGTVSELATRRSEFSSVLRQGGPSALVDLLQRKVAELSG